MKNRQAQIFEEAQGLRPPPGGRLVGRKILVVGAGQREIDDEDPPVGNGRAISVLFAGEGAELTCVDVAEPALRTTCEAIEAIGGKVHPEIADVGEASAIAPLVERATKNMSGLDGIVMVVGISGGKKLDQLDSEIWDREFAVNVRSNMLLAQAAMQHMSPGGSIVLISSIAALFSQIGFPCYEASKAAQVSLARSIAKAGQEKGIRCNSILPGYMDTPMGRVASKRRPDRNSRGLPFGRQGTGWEVAYPTLFLMSHESSYVNGHALVVDGGFVLGITRPQGG